MAAVSFNIIKQYDKDYVTEYLSSCIESYKFYKLFKWFYMLIYFVF